MITRNAMAALASAAFALSGAAGAQAPEPRDEICLSCHAVPSARFHSQPSHKKLTCAQCHVGGAEHVNDKRLRPRLAGDDALCASCHAPKKKHGGN